MDTDRRFSHLARMLATAFAGLVLLPAGTALAADPPCDKTWTGGSGAWGDGSHWNPAGVPSNQVACLPAGSYTVTYPGGLPSITGLVVGAGATVVTQNDYTTLSSSGEVINRGTVQLVSRTNLNAPAVTNSGTIEDSGLLAATPQVQTNAFTNTGTVRANAALQVWGNGGGTFTNNAGGKVVSNAVGSSMSFWAMSAVSFAAGTVTNNGDLPMSTGAFTAGSVTGTGLPVRVVGGNPTPVLDLSGTGALAVDLDSSAYMAADVAKDMTLNVRSLGGSPLGDGYGHLVLTGPVTNRGTLSLRTDGTYAQDADVAGSGGTERLTNAGTMTVAKGSGGNRVIGVPFTNAAAGSLSVGPGTGLVLRNFNDNTAHVNAGTITLDATGSLAVDGAQTMTFTQTGGTITTGGAFEQQAGTFAHQGGTISGKVRVAQRRGTPALDASGPGAAAYEIAGQIDLAGDVNAAATIDASPRSDIGSAVLRLTADRTNNGTIRLGANDNTYDSAVSDDGALHTLTNKGAIEVRKGSGGNRFFSPQLSNAATGTLDVGPGARLYLRNFGLPVQHTSAGTIAVDATGSLVVDGMADIGFTQTGGTIAAGGGFYQTDGLHKHTAGTITGQVSLRTGHGVPVRLDPSGTGTASYNISGSVDLAGDVSATATIEMAAHSDIGSSTLRLTSNRTNNGTLRLGSYDNTYDSAIGDDGTLRTLTNNGRIEVRKGTGGNRFFSPQLANAAAGTVDVGPDARLYLRNYGLPVQHTSAGTIAIDPAGSMVVDGSADLSFTQTGGTITSGGGFYQYDGLHKHTAGTVTGRVTLHSVHGTWARLDPSGTGSPTFEMHYAQLAGTVAAGTTVDVHGESSNGAASMELTSPQTNNGTIVLDDTGGYSAELRGAELTNKGTLRVDPGGGRTLSLGLVTAAGGTTQLGADLTAINTATADEPALKVTGGTLRISAGVTAWAGLRQTGGSTVLAGGAIVIPRDCPTQPANCKIDVAGGTFSGYGTLYAPVLNRGGVLQVGATDKPYATLALKDTTEYQHVRQTSYTQTAAGTLSVGVNGRTAGTGFDQMTVEGPAALDGELDIATGSGFHPDSTTPDRFEIVKAESRSGQWATLSGDDSGPYALEYTATGATLKAIASSGPAVRVSVADAQVAEGDSGLSDLVFHVKLSAASAQPVSVDYATADDTAVAPGDYTAASGTLTFAPGETDKTVTVKVAGDTAVESAEQLLLRLSHPVGALLGTARATGTILADDLGVTSVAPGAAGDVGTTTLTITGGGLAAGDTVTLRRSGSPDRTATVAGAAADGSRLAARADLTDAAHGAWDVRVTAPGGATATAAGALTVVAAVAPRLSVAVSSPSSLRFGWPGSAVVSVRNEGNADAPVALLRVSGENVQVRSEDQADFHDTLDLADDDLTKLWTSWGGGNVIPAGATRSVVVRFQSTTSTAHAALKLNAAVYAEGLVEQEVGGADAAAPAGRITGHLRDGDGEPVAGVAVTASAPPAAGAGHTRGYNAAVAVTGSDGAFTLGPLADGAYTVGVGREPTAAADAKHVTVSGGSTPAADLTADVATLAGRLRSSGGTAQRGTVSLLRGGQVVATQDTAADGGFSFAVLRSGTYNLIGRTATGGGLAVGGDLTVSAGHAQTGIDLRTGSRALTVTVTDGGAPVDGATVAVSTGATGGVPLVLSTGADGKAAFGGLPSGSVTVRAASATRAPATATATGATAALALPAGATVTGTVTASGSPVAGATVAATVSGETRSAVTGSDGQYTISGMPAGAATLWTTGGGLAPLRSTATLTAGGTATANVALTSGGSAQTLSSNGIANARFDILDAATGTVLRSVFAGAGGTASSGLLRAGDYSVRTSVPGAAPATRALAVAARPVAHRDAGDPGTTEVAEPVDTENPLDRPPMVTWSGLPEPQQTPWHRAHHEYDYTKIVLKEPCPAGNRMKAIISRYATALSRSWDSYYAAWDLLRIQDRLDVANYLLKASDVGAKATLALASLNSTIRGMETPLPGSLTNAVQALSNNLATTVGRNRAGESADIWTVRDGLADVLQTAAAYQQEIGGSAWSGHASDAFAALSALKGIFDLADEMASLPEEVRARGDAFREQENHYYDLQRTINELTNRLRAIAAKCPDPYDNDDPKPSGSGSGSTDNVMPGDPNDILGPQGAGPEGWIPAGQDLAYQVRFENLGPGSLHNPQNLPLATAPAVLVKIDEQLDADVDLDSVELGDVGWGEKTVTVPAGRQSYHGDVPSSDGDIVRVDGSLDRATRTLHWTITSIDPKTGETETSPTKGFLPPEDGSGNGQGYAAYRARAKDGLAHGTAITAKAAIVFDANAVIETPTHTNTIDITPPASAVTSAAQPGAGTASCQSKVMVNWSGSDTGAGLAAYDVWVATDGGAPKPFMLGTTATSGTFTGGTAGHSYAFWTTARDAVGLVEAPPAGADKAIIMARCDATAPKAVATITGAAAKDGWRDGPVDVRLDAIDDAGGLGVSKVVWSATGAQGGGATVDGDTTTVHVAGEGVTTLRYAGVDAAGNRTPERVATVRIDRSAPEIDVRTPAEGAQLTQGDAVAADFACADAGAGVATCAGSPAAGAPLDTATPGEHTVTVHAEDRLGHAADVTRRYTVVAPPSGGPAPNPPGGGGGGGGGTPPRGPAFSARPLTIAASTVTRSGTFTLTLRNREAFAITGRTALSGKLPRQRKAVALAGAASVKLAARGSQKLTVRLSSRARAALRARHAITATLTLTLRAGTATKTVKATIRLRPPR